MRMPFTESQFLEVLGAFNVTLWPVLVLLWAASVVAAIQVWRGRCRPAVGAALLAIHWAWSGVAYHAVYFSRINPAAWAFAALFVAEAAALLWVGVVRRRLRFSPGWTLRSIAGSVLVVFALIYPALIVLTGHALPQAPAFGVPCPTTIFTAGLLLLARPPVPRWLYLAPIVWSIIGGSAAVLFGITPDFMLVVAGLLMIVYGVLPSAARAESRSRATEADAARAMAGDGFVPEPNYQSTIGIDIDARPEFIWPWLVQMGYQRGGLYSYDRLDQWFGYLDRPSATRILPEFQSLREGDVIPIGKGAAFPVRSVRPLRALVLGGEEQGLQWIWEFGLYPLDLRRTRLVSRSRLHVPRTWRWRAFMLVLGPAAFVMTRRMLMGIRTRAEALAAGKPVAAKVA